MQLIDVLSINAPKRITILLRLCIFALILFWPQGPIGNCNMAEPPADPGDRTAVAAYVATLTADLCQMARHTGLDTLGYLLEMARLEAENLARPGPHAPNGGR
jgi:hypothetical protein